MKWHHTIALVQLSTAARGWRAPLETNHTNAASILLETDRKLSLFGHYDTPSPTPNEPPSGASTGPATEPALYADPFNIFKRTAIEEAYQLPPIQLTDELLEAFEVTHFWKRGDQQKHLVPRELSTDPNDPDWSFLGVLREPTPEESLKEAAKRKKMQAYYESLTQEDQEILDGKLAERDHAKHLERRAMDMYSWNMEYDDREELGIALLNDGSVWALQASPKDGTQDIREWLEYAGSASSTHATNETTWLRGNGKQRGRKLNKGIGLNLRSGYNGYDMKAFPWSAQGCFSETPYSENCFCSGTKISARLVLTAAHCQLEKERTWRKRAYWLPGADGLNRSINGKDETPNGYRGSAVRYVSPEYFEHLTPSHDWGLFVLSAKDYNCELGQFRIAAPPSLMNFPVYVFGYPGNQCEASPLKDKSCGHSIYGDSAKVAREWETMFGYFIDTQGGLSGSGVYVKSNKYGRVVVGVHTKGSPSAGRQYGLGVHITQQNGRFIAAVLQKFPDRSACD